MNAAAILTECARRGVTLRAADGMIRFRPASAVDDELRAALRELKPELLAELRRDAAAATVWERLRETYARVGSPPEWLTGDVRLAEHQVEQLWVSSRINPADDVLFYRALRRWERIAVAAILEAAQ